MAGDLADKSTLLIEIHSLEVRLVTGKDLIGLWDNPDLEGRKRVSRKGCRISNRKSIPQNYHLQ